jgi:hypothetical protein
VNAVLDPDAVVEGLMNGADSLDCPDFVCPPRAQGGRRLIVQGNNASVWRLVFQWYQVTPAADLAPLFANLAAIDPSLPLARAARGVPAGGADLDFDSDVDIGEQRIHQHYHGGCDRGKRSGASHWHGPACRVRVI